MAISNAIKSNTLIHAPEKIGTSAKVCAIPTENGLKIPAAKPAFVPSVTIAVPVSLSNFNIFAAAIPTGTNTTDAVERPIVKPKIENIVKKRFEK